MAQLLWKPEITLGNIGTLATTIVVLTAGWTTIQNRLENTANRLDRIEARVAQGETDDKQRDQLMSADRLVQTKTLTEMGADIRYMRAAIEAMQRQTQKGAN